MLSNKHMCLPLGDGGNGGPKLYVEGSLSLGRSSGCLAWSIPPVPATKSKLGGASAASAAANSTDLVAAAVDDQTTTPAKKASKKPEPIPTHIMDFMEMRVVLQKTEHIYQVPFLRDNPEHAHVFAKCYRARTPWDDGDVLKKEKTQKLVKTFLNS